MIPVGNQKWQPSRGHNEFTGQGANNKEDDEWYEGISSESKVLCILRLSLLYVN